VLLCRRVGIGAKGPAARRPTIHPPHEQAYFSLYEYHESRGHTLASVRRENTHGSRERARENERREANPK
jgi:hypothetical protein